MGRWADAAIWSVIDGSNRVARALKSPGDPRPLPMAPWIEPTLDGWLERQPRDRPVHCFINFVDAHEKYLSDARLVPGVTAWIRFLGIPQSSRLWLSGQWRPGPRALDLLRRLYELTLAGLDRRVGAVIDSLRRAGRWENTLLVVTSDHGQAFGEHGELFHERSPFEPLLHVPLWIRWPYGAGGSRLRRENVSLVDLAPTLLEAAGLQPPPGLPGVALQPHSSPTRESPVLAMADGYPSIEHFRGTLEGSVLERLRRSYSIAYSGEFKAIVEIRDGSLQTFDIVSDPAEQVNLGAATGGEQGRAETYARQAAVRILRASQGPVDPDVQDRLRSWGYL